jgi:hypothetical protein
VTLSVIPQVLLSGAALKWTVALFLTFSMSVAPFTYCTSFFFARHSQAQVRTTVSKFDE